MKPPYAPLIPWLGVAGLLAAALAGVHLLLVAPTQDRLVRLDAEWAAARERLATRLEAKQARKDLARVLSVLPTRRDFERLPLTISEGARKDGVELRSLSYALEKPEAGLATKVTFQGPATGRYENLRRFIHHLETSDRLLFIEDLSLGASTEKADPKKGEMVTFNLKLATYIRGESPPTGTSTL
jgi:Tfp pilus assembly protein PilO